MAPKQRPSLSDQTKDRLVSLQPARFPRHASSLVALALGTLVLASSCSKKTPTPTASEPAPPSAAVTSANSAPDLPELNRTLLRWTLANRRRPASFEDFAATAGGTIPPPPAGKKYIIRNDMHIALVDR